MMLQSTKTDRQQTPRETATGLGKGFTRRLFAAAVDNMMPACMLADLDLLVLLRSVSHKDRPVPGTCPLFRLISLSGLSPCLQYGPALADRPRPSPRRPSRRTLLPAPRMGAPATPHKGQDPQDKPDRACGLRRGAPGCVASGRQGIRVPRRLVERRRRV
jgi:hypothetical protein